MTYRNLILFTTVLILMVLFPEIDHKQQYTLVFGTGSQQGQKEEYQGLTSSPSKEIPKLLTEQRVQWPKLGLIMPQISKLDTKMPKQGVKMYIGFLHDMNMGSPDSNFNAINNNRIIPRTFLVDPITLVNAKKSIMVQNSSILQSSLDELLRKADRYLSQAPSSVMEKPLLPPSGDKHDYLSLSKYYWPDPTKLDGLPYINHDGKVNPTSYSIPDERNLQNVIDSVKILSLSYYVTNNELYASKTVEFLRTWFMDSKTRMNPNLDFAQSIPGRGNSNQWGIIDAHNLPEVIDGIGLIQNSRSWTAKDQSSITHWFEQYLDWLLNSDAGKIQAKKLNNHGTWYDEQVASIALFLNKTEIAKSIIQKNTINRLTDQIQADGSQPFEIQRTKSLSYSIFNLVGLFRLANIAEHVGINLWTYKTTNGAGLLDALYYLVPYLLNKKDWPYKQIDQLDTHDYNNIVDLLYQASARYRGHFYIDSYNSLIHGKGIVMSINNLLYRISYQQG